MLVTASPWVKITVFIGLACKVMVKVEVRVTTKLPVRARARDQKQISRDYALASELVQAVPDP